MATEIDTFWQEIREDWRSDAKAVLEIVKQGSGVIVSAPHKTGKSSLFAPTFTEEATQLGYTVKQYLIRGNFPVTDWPFGNKCQGLLEGLKSGPGNIIILDEVARPQPLEGFFPTVFQTLKERDITPVLINAAYTREDRTKISQELISIAQNEKMKLEPYEMRQMHANPEIIKKYLTTWGTQPELIGFFLDPSHRALLTPGAIGRLYNNISRGRVTYLNQLRDYFDETWINIWGELDRLGGSGTEMLRVFSDLGLTESYEEEELEDLTRRAFFYD